MEFSSTELFAEILVAGLLVSFSVSPILILSSPTARQKGGLLPFSGEWKPWIILVVAFVYAVGIGGNRLVGELYTALHIEANVNSGSVQLERAEFVIRDHGEIARDWIERHKSYRKILRMASFSSVLLLLSMIVYRIAGRKYPRYLASHYIAAMILCLFFFASFIQEDNDYKTHLAMYAQVLKETAPNTQPNRDGPVRHP
jgi:hypothetical protein